MMKEFRLPRVSRRVALMLLVLLLNACASATAHPAQAVVKRMYDALSAGNSDAYMDTILPENRQQGSLAPGFLSAFSFGLGPINIAPSKLTSFSVKNLKVDLLSSTKDYALVRARGKVRYPIMAMELNFCDEHDVRLAADGKWYVDIYAPERAARMQRIQARLLQELAQTPGAGGEEDLLGMLKDIGPTMEKALNLCE